MVSKEDKETATMRIARVLLVFASLLLVLGGVAHTAAFPKPIAALAASNLPALFVNAFKALWLMDSSTMFALAVVLLWIVARPASVTGAVVMLLALIPAGITVLLYWFLGNFFAAHILLVAT